MKVIMTGGGTGGHIYPAIAIADEIKKRYPQAEFLFVGAERGLEKTIVPERGYEIKLITVAGFNRKNPFKNIEVVRKLMKGSNQAREIIANFKPDFVIGTGGYASAPLVRAAQKAGVPSYIHEQNAIPGMTNKLLEKHVRKVFLGFAKAGEHFKHKEKQVVVGNPVRDEFMTLTKEEARKKLGFEEDEFVLLAFGGSQGAGRINKAMISVIKELSGEQGMRIVLGAGSYYYDAILTSLREDGFEIPENVNIMEYIHDMASYLKAADLVVSRSGALTVAETTVCGTPAIFIPSPIVTGNHQYYNALAVCEEGGAEVIEEKDLENEKLIREILRLKSDPQTLSVMSEKCAAFGPRQATKIICDTVLEDYMNE
ncbi:MAG: undecaprenyldiphospho-muramoylpentapeptide beta-N-acetylglucosaminyltransferase [Bacillota bacterium]|nr:undecaprenyldiphospho-muramoylpentapeptide beta-N-acetylglucosaminyltransferase [Bacillota bacterium]